MLLAAFRLFISPEAALKRLLPLTLQTDAQLFLKEATRFESGEIDQMAVPWLKVRSGKRSSPVMRGMIVLEQGRLMLCSESEQLIKAGKKAVVAHLGDEVMFEMTSRDPSQMLPMTPTAFVNPTIHAQVEKRWRGWFDERLSDLNNQTPRESAKTRSGQRALDGLLLDMEKKLLMEHDIYEASAMVFYLCFKLGRLGFWESDDEF